MERDSDFTDSHHWEKQEHAASPVICPSPGACYHSSGGKGVIGEKANVHCYLAKEKEKS